MVVMDTAARAATAAEIPVSILTAIVGSAGIFIILLRKTGGARLVIFQVEHGVLWIQGKNPILKEYQLLPWGTGRCFRGPGIQRCGKDHPA